MHRRPAVLLSCLLVAALGSSFGSVARSAAYPPGARAGGPYAELQFGASAVSHSGLDFVSPLAGVSAGAYLLPGIGIELFADRALDRGADGRFEASLEEAFGVAARFRSPSEGGLHGYVVLGYVDFTIAQESLDDGREIEERFTGVRVSIGVMQRFERVPNLALSAEYRNFHVDDSIEVDGLSLGVRFDVR